MSLCCLNELAERDHASVTRPPPRSFRVSRHAPLDVASSHSHAQVMVGSSCLQWYGGSGVGEHMLCQATIRSVLHPEKSRWIMAAFVL